MDVRVDGKYYEAMKPQSFAERLGVRARERIYADFLRLCRPRSDDAILDVGVSDVVGDAANMLEQLYPYLDRVTAVGLGVGDDFRTTFPSIAYHQVEPNQRLPFTDGAFDIAISNAVLEHVGSFANQCSFITELLRVAKRIFITVPHRFFPVEHHTGIPLLHWSDASFGMACRLTGKAHWSREEELILMSHDRLSQLLPKDRPFEIGYTGLVLGPCSSNLYLYINAGNVPE